MKQYELTNHLGNVMAVVSDKRVHLDDNGDTLIDRYSPSLAAVYDYFPFGMLMPGRYLQDDATHCMTITQTQIVPVRVPVIDHVTGPFSPVKGGSGIFVPLDEDVVITASSVGSGVEISHSVTAGAALALELEVKTVEYGSFSVVISEEVAGKQVVLGGIGIQARGAYSASVVPQSSTVKVSITASSAQAQGARLIIKPYVWTWTVPTPKAVPVVVCNDREDYRFGFNGQEKVNEIAGIGNHTTALFWEYDTRIARRWNLDPVDQISISNYSVMWLNPILRNDPLGNYSRVGAWLRNAVNGGNGISYTKRTGEWGYEKPLKEGGVSYRDGYKDKLKKQWLDDYNNHEFVSGIYKHSTGGRDLDMDVMSGAVSDAPMTTKDRINAGLNMSSPGFLTSAPSSLTVAPGRVFWSGGRDVAGKEAMSFAKAHGKITLEMTTSGKVLETVGKVVPYKYTSPLWNALSRRFAGGASGTVDFFTTPLGPRAGSIWLKIEKPILENKGVEIIQHTTP